MELTSQHYLRAEEWMASSQPHLFLNESDDTTIICVCGIKMSVIEYVINVNLNKLIKQLMNSISF